MTDICSLPFCVNTSYFRTELTGVARGTNLHGLVHDLADLLGMGLREASAENGEVLAEHEHCSPVDFASPGYLQHTLYPAKEVKYP